jgi:hypothetical protein
MGFYLQNDSGKRHQMDSMEWRNILRMARRYGWQPMGTEPNKDYLSQRARNPDGGHDKDVLNNIIGSWRGSYLTKERQFVTYGSYLTKERQFVTYADALNMAFALEDAVHDNGIEEEAVRGFISFCKKGRFSIM